MTGPTLQRCVVCESRNPVGAERCSCCSYRLAPRPEPFEVDEELAPLVRVVRPDGEPAVYAEQHHDVGIRVQSTLPAAMLIPASWAFVTSGSLLFGCIEWNRSTPEIVGGALLLVLVVYWIVVVNHSTIRVSGGRLRVRSGPLPWRGGLDLPLAAIVGFECEGHAHKQGRPAEVRVCALLRDGGRRVVVTALTAAHAQLVQDLLELEHAPYAPRASQ
jgi:hypothetical protein